MKTILMLIILIFLCCNIYSEELEFIYPLSSDPLFDTTPEYTFFLPKNPTKAGLLSAFIPGAGQIYNEKYIKAGAVIGIQATLVGVTIHNDRKMREYRDKRNNADPLTLDFANYQLRYRDYYDSRQSFIFWVAASVFLSAMDAYVDAHLINFRDKRNQIRLKFEDQMLQVSFSF